MDWCLDNIYTSTESYDFLNDLKKYEQEIENLNDYALKNLKNSFKDDDLNIKDCLEYYIYHKNKILNYEKLSCFLNLKLSKNTNDKKCLNILSKLEDIEIKNVFHEVIFNNYLKNIENLKNIIETSKILKQHEFILTETKKNSKYILDEKVEKTIDTLRLSGSNLWKKQWEQLTSNLTINFEQKELTLSEIRNLAYSSCEQTRKNAYLKEIEAYKKIEFPIAFSLNGIKSEVLKVSKLKGYKSPLEQTLLDSRLDKKTLYNMISAIEKSLEKLQTYFVKKAKLLNKEKNSLEFYNLFAPVGSFEQKFSYDQAKEYVLNNFYKFSKDLGDFAKNAMDSNWIDVLPKKFKVGGAFCEPIHSIKQSRILLNFSGSLNDVLTLAHELGHAYHSSLIFDETYLNSVYTMPIAETASTMCETIVINELLKTSKEKEKICILDEDLSNTLQCIVDIYSRFLFEDEVFKKVKDGFVLPDDLNEIMINSQKKAYGNSLNPKYLHKYMWICKPHYYDAHSNYYNFPYAYGVLFSKGLYCIYLEDKQNFIKNYKKMLSLSGKQNLESLASIMGINIQEEDFWLKSLNSVIKNIEKL